jgi:hypothetical protein
MTQLGVQLRATGQDVQSVEEVAQRVVTLLHNEFVDPGSGVRACVLVRFYLTVRYADLDGGLRAFGDKLMTGHQLTPETRCLTLLATAGEETAWNSRKASVGHQTIPLPSKQVVQAIPMISQLITQLGLDVGTVVAPDPALVLELEQRTYNVFFVPDAVGSPHIPAQNDFVLPYKIRSVLGFGGLVPSGDVYAVLMFARVSVPRAAADIFRNAAMNLKLALLSAVDLPVFRSPNSGKTE